MSKIEQLKNMYRELKESMNKQSNIRYDKSLMENKLETDTVFYEMLFLSFNENLLNEQLLLQELNEKLTTYYAIINQIYELFDMKPYILGYHLINEHVDLSDYNSYIKKVAEILKEEYNIIYEACKRNKNKQKYEKVMKKFKQKVTESDDINMDEIKDKVEAYVIISELMDRIAFPHINYKIFTNYSSIVENEDIIDKEYVDKLFEEYEKVKDEIIDLVL